MNKQADNKRSPKRETGNLSGIELRPNSIRLVFSLMGKQVKPTLFAGDEPMKPTQTNIDYAVKRIRIIKKEIKEGTFDFAEHFPRSPLAKVLGLKKPAPDASINPETQAPWTLSEYLEKWYKQAPFKKSTMGPYRNMMNNLWKPALGDKLLREVKHSDITETLVQGKRVSNKTYNNRLSMIKGVFAFAVHSKAIVENPTENIRPLPYKSKMPDPFKMTEMVRILRHMFDHYPELVGNFFEFKFLTGLRTGEAIAVNVEDIDLEDRVLRVTKAFVIDEITGTKTQAERTVHLSEHALETVRRQLEWLRRRPDGGVPCLHPTGPLFLDPSTGKPWAYEQNARKSYWVPTLEALGIRYRRPYNTRHTYASLGILAGARPAFLAQQLGNRLDVFCEYYARWIEEERNRAEVGKIDRELEEMFLGGIIPALSPRGKKSP